MGGSGTAYLDHAASTPLRREALEAMAPFVSGRFANASGSHRAAREARQAVEEARDQIAEAVGVGPAEVVFTSGGTEADNLAVFGSLAASVGAGVHASAVCSAIEHPAVLEPMRAAARARPPSSESAPSRSTRRGWTRTPPSTWTGSPRFSDRTRPSSR